MKALSRRAVLKAAVAGGVAALPLPLLELMRDGSGEALAGGAPVPDRFGLWFWGNGMRPEHWTPPTQGSGWTPSVELEPLADLVPYLSIATGCEMKVATHPHHSGMAGILTGRKYHQLGYVRDTIVSTFDGPSVDQIAADWFLGQAPFRSIEAGVTWFRGTDEGSTFQHLSHNGPNNPNPSEYDPVRLYERLFAMPTDTQRDLARRSVLDALDWRGSRLQTRLGSNDRARMQQYLDSVRALELQIDAAGKAAAGCVATAPGSSYPDVSGLEQIESKNLAVSQLIATALACDLMRAFSVQFSTCASGVIVWQVGASNGLHVICHEEAMPQPTVHAATTFTMGQLAVFLRTLRDTPEADGSLLDRCSILCTSELSDGRFHSNTEFPLMIAGLGGGRLRGGVHWRSGSADNASKVVLTALRGAGVDLESFGSDGGYVDQVVPELMT
jgi:hypothetical protein